MIKRLWHEIRERLGRLKKILAGGAAMLRPGGTARRRRFHLYLGRLGERIAEDYLRSRGYELLCRNFRYRKSEIDLVMRLGEILCFVEVKTRRRKPGVFPADAVDEHKEEMLYRGGAGYLREIRAPYLTVRFDIVEVLTVGRRPVTVRHWPGDPIRLNQIPGEAFPSPSTDSVSGASAAAAPPPGGGQCRR